MVDDPKDKSYEVESESANGGETAPAERRQHGHRLAREGEAEPLDLEPDKAATPASSSSVKALDVCPNCGAAMPGADTLVCMRCGFDLKRLKVVETATGEIEAEPEEKEPEPLSPSGRGDLWLPGALAAGSLLLLSIGYLFGSEGLLGPEASGGDRVSGVIKVLVRTAMVAASGLGGLAVLANVGERPLGDLKQAAVRMLGIVSVVTLATFFHAQAAPVEWTIEIILQAGAFMALAVGLYGLNARNAATLLGLTVVTVAAFLLMSWFVVWSLT